MFRNNFSEEEFKKMVKTLTAEKKIMPESPQDTEIEMLKDQLARVKPALKKLYDELKETKAEIEKFQGLEQEKQHLQKLITQLQSESLEQKNGLLSAGQEIEIFRKNFEEEKRKNLLLENDLRTFHLKLEEKEKQLTKVENKHTGFEEERARLFEKMADSVTQSQRLADQNRDLQMENHALQEAKKHLESEVEHLKVKVSQTHLELTQFERTIERLSIEQKENENIKKHFERLSEDHLRLKLDCSTFSKELEKKENEIELLKKALADAPQGGDLSGLRSEYEEKLALQIQEKEMLVSEKEKTLSELRMTLQASEMFQRQEKERALEEERKTRSELIVVREEYNRHLHEKEKTHEETLSASYVKLRELFEKNNLLHEEIITLKEALEQKEELFAKREQEIQTLEQLVQTSKSKSQEKESEIKKAQAHLAKKVKENTMLRDLMEKQKNQLIELQNLALNYKNEIEKLKSGLQLQRIHEEKLEAIAKERTQAAENLSKEWQDKYFALHLEWQESKAQLAELIKMKKQFEQLQTTFAHVKSYLAKTFELPLKEEKKPYDEEFFET